MKRLWLVLAGIAFVCSANADLLIGWNVTNTPGNHAFQPPASLAPNVSTGDITRGSGLVASAATNAFLASSWFVGGAVADAITANDYFSFTVTADSGYTLSITNFSVFLNRSGTGPTNFTLRSSSDSFGSDLATFVRTGTTAGWESAPLTIGGLSSVEFRLYGYRAGAAGGTARVAESGGSGIGGTLDAAIFGSVVPEPGSVALFGLGLAMLGHIRRRRRC